VTAIIKFVPSLKPTNKITIDYFHIIGNDKMISVTKTSTGKNLVKPNCEVVEIPKSFINSKRT